MSRLILNRCGGEAIVIHAEGFEPIRVKLEGCSRAKLVIEASPGIRVDREEVFAARNQE